MTLNRISREKLQTQAEKEVDLLESFDKSLEKACFSYFEYSFVVSTLIYYEENVSKKEKLKTKLADNNNKFREFCQYYEPYLKFTKMIVKMKEYNERLEVEYNYNTNHDFINNIDLDRIVIKNKERSDRTLSLQHIYFVNQKYGSMLEIVRYINDKKKEYNFCIEEFTNRLNKLKDLTRKNQIYTRLTMLNIIRSEMYFKCTEFYKSYFTQVVMKRQTNFAYNEAKFKLEDVCAICLEKFKRRRLITKLKCNHYYCTECITKWFSSASKCPTCRRKYYLI